MSRRRTAALRGGSRSRRIRRSRSSRYSRVRLLQPCASSKGVHPTSDFGTESSGPSRLCPPSSYRSAVAENPVDLSLLPPDDGFVGRVDDSLRERGQMHLFPKHTIREGDV